MNTGRFTDCDFEEPLPGTAKKGNYTRYARVDWIEPRSALQVSETEKKSSCIECVSQLVNRSRTPDTYPKPTALSLLCSFP
eukprot:COSAG02_NODE_51634_length_313_cov_0.528037_1_plen_80_part_10